MNFIKSEKNKLAQVINSNAEVSRLKKLKLVIALSIPAIVAQVSAIIMQYIDASMVGSLGANPAASIGLVSTSTWIFFGLCSAASVGFSVQVAHLIGASKTDSAKNVFRQSLVATLIFSIIMAVIGVAISGPLPHWLGGEEAITANATLYFRVTLLAMPVFQLSYLASGMLRCSGNMVFPGMAGVLMCVLDVVFNFFLIFPTREIHIFSLVITVPGADFGVWGAALGTALAEAVATFLMLRKLIFSSALRIWRERGSFLPAKSTLRKAFHIGAPMGLERLLTCSAQVVLTIIVAPLGACAIAANSFAITAESICYMPGYGIAEAATTLVGQSIGAAKKKLAREFAHISVGLGMAVMTVMGVVMYVGAPAIIGIMTPDAEIVKLGVEALRIEAWAEPLFAAAIVCYGVFVGAGDTIIPSCFNLGCMWGIRITLAAILAPVYGLAGVWIAMCIELCCRGTLFLGRLKSSYWLKRSEKLKISNA